MWSLESAPRLAWAGLGITVQGDGFVPAGLSELPTSPALPELGQIEFVLAGPARTLRGPASALAKAILGFAGSVDDA